jgi:hypothetical protein
MLRDNRLGARYSPGNSSRDDLVGATDTSDPFGNVYESPTLFDGYSLTNALPNDNEDPHTHENPDSTVDSSTYKYTCYPNENIIANKILFVGRFRWIRRLRWIWRFGRIRRLRRFFR